MLSPVLEVPTPMIRPTPPDPRELDEVEEFPVPVAPAPVAPVVEGPDVDPGVEPPIVAPVKPADSADPPLTVLLGVVPPIPLLIIDEADPRPPPTPVVFKPPSG